MRLNAFSTGSIAPIILFAITAQSLATVPTPIPQHAAYGKVSFSAGQIHAAGNGFTITRQGVGLYTITYNTPFTGMPQLVIDPVQTSIGISTHDLDHDGINDFTTIEDGGTDAFQFRCRILTQSVTGFSMECAGLDAISLLCTQTIDEFGHIITICTYARLSRADISFSFSAFGSHCSADIVVDQNVNVNDLLAVINAWGPCAQPDNCPADIAPSNGDNFVNVNDLLAVINGWGPCP